MRRSELVDRLDRDLGITGPVEDLWQDPSVQENRRRFRELCHHYRVNLIGGTHYATERPAMVAVVELFRKWGIPATYMEDHDLLQAT